MSRFIALLPFCFFCVSHSFAQKPTFSEERLKKIDTYFDQLIQDKKLAGAVTLISNNAQIRHFEIHGLMDLNDQSPMRKDAIIPIGSMTKIITSIAVLQLYEDGRFLLNDPVEDYIPEFKNLRVLVSPDTMITEPLKSRLTIRDLMRHTAGMVYGGGSSITDKLYTQAGFRTWDKSLPEFVKQASEIPLAFQPNSDWRYSYSHDILGYLIEKVSGMSLRDYFRGRIFEPLGLSNTDFIVTKSKSKQLPTLYRYMNNQLTIDVPRKESIYYQLPNALSGGGRWGTSYGGIITTIEEFHTICAMLLNFGTHNGARLLGRKTVELMMADHIGNKSAFGDGYGLGLGVIRSLGDTGTVGSIGEVYWAGAPYNTYFWIDYREKIIGVLFTNTAPFSHAKMMDKFKVLALQALDN